MKNNVRSFFLGIVALVVFQASMAVASEPAQIVIREKETGRQIAIACVDERCERFIFVETLGERTTALNPKDYSATELAELQDTLYQSVRHPYPFYYTYTLYHFSHILDHVNGDGAIALYLSIGMQGIQGVIIAVVETIYRPFQYVVIATSNNTRTQKIKKVLRPSQEGLPIRQVTLGKDSYQKIRAAIVDL